METRLSLVMAALVLGAAFLPARAQDEEKKHEAPPVFSALDYAAALQKAKAEKRLLILDAMTSWCGPCKQMDKTTWVDADLVAWIKEHAVAIQLDMDLHTAVKTSLDITAFPTIVVFKGDAEIERVVGSRDAAFMADWLKGLKDGRTRKDTMKARWTAIKDKPGVPVAERVDVFSMLVETDLLDEARSMALGLWRESAAWDEATRQRLFFELLGAIASLTKADGGASADFTKAAGEIAPEHHPERFDDWFMLCMWTDGKDAVLAWAHAAAETPKGRALLAEKGGRGLYDTLVREGEWRAAGFTLTDVVERIEQSVGWRERQAKTGAMPAMRAVKRGTKQRSFEELLDRQAEDDAALFHAALLAAGRFEEAWKAADAILKARDNPRSRAALVAKAIEAGCLDAERHGKLLAALVDD